MPDGRPGGPPVGELRRDLAESGLGAGGHLLPRLSVHRVGQFPALGRGEALPPAAGDGEFGGLCGLVLPFGFLLDKADLAIACAQPATALSRTTVRELLRGRRPAQVHPGDTLHRSAVVLSLAGADALVVAAERGIPVGLVTAGDVVAAFAGQKPAAWTAPADGPPGGGPHVLLPGLPPRRQERRTGVP
ncbi:hypothetical protein GCM10009663_60500 [Kitasatospora arboriphila]|uniref:CBS domain-containing protein n=1 Tax=Kitasatospora arboriphila TaxID=258052 RepID=A0ABN1U1H9_9ACTN